MTRSTVTKILVREKIGPGDQFFHGNWCYAENFGPTMDQFSMEYWSGRPIFSWEYWSRDPFFHGILVL